MINVQLHESVLFYYLQKYYCDMNIINVIILSLCSFKATISEIDVRNYPNNQDQKIVGGEDAKQGQFPYQVNINLISSKSGHWSQFIQHCL